MQAAAPRLLICEDDFLVASDLARSLAALGAEVVGFAISAAKAMELAMSQTLAIDAAVLDVNLAGEPVFPAARALKQRGVRVVFYSGHSRRDLPPDFGADPFVSKPAPAQAIMAGILAAGGATG